MEDTVTPNSKPAGFKVKRSKFATWPGHCAVSWQDT